MTPDPAHPDTRTRTPLRRAMAAVRSSVRRYPSHLLASLRHQETADAHAHRPLLDELACHAFAACWLGHASVLLGLDGRSVVVDPVLSHRIGPRVRARTIGLERLAPAPVGPSALRGVDLILITHAHFDHLDRPTLASLTDTRTTVVVPARCARLVPDGFGEVIELVPADDLEIVGLSMRAHTPRHWGARAWLDRGRGCNAYEVRHGRCSALLAGDTAQTDVFEALDPVDLAVFGIGAYEPWDHMHATPEQVWRMFTRMPASRLLPVHHSTFELSDEAHDEPMRRLHAVAGDDSERVLASDPGRVMGLRPGIDRPRRDPAR